MNDVADVRTTKNPALRKTQDRSFNNDRQGRMCINLGSLKIKLKKKRKF